MDTNRLNEFVASRWRDSITPKLLDYVRIPNKSPLFEPGWEQLGHMEKAVQLMADWCKAQALRGATVSVRRLSGRTPILLVDIPGENDGCALLYGHLDKQPEFTGWLPGLSPWEPVIRDGRLYGRGGADDGYAVFASLTAIAALQQQGIRHPRYLVLGEPSLVVCLDAECGNYSQLWCTTSLRGTFSGSLRIRVLREGVHSGMGTGIAPTPFRIAQQLLARLENPVTGDIVVEALQAQIPRDRLAQARAAATVLGAEIAGKMPFVSGARALSNDPVELLLGSTWRATLAVTGADGLPAIQTAGNVLLPEITLKLSLRLPPTVDAASAATLVRDILERDPPYGASVSFEPGAAMSGWNAPPFADWLEASMQRASQAVFGQPAVHAGCGGSIPFMGMLGAQFPKTQFLITGVLGPQSNAHGPNEFLHLAYAEKLTALVTRVLADHARL
jgi:acetylornithine deacetylase/succinyl-diaminopimelate desuccinylase-like protein